MKTLLLCFLTSFSLAVCGQTKSNTPEVFLGVPVLVHYATVNPGDSLVLPPHAYIKEIYVIEHGDYVVYSGGASFVYTDLPGVNHLVHRDEGMVNVNGLLQQKNFDPEGNEKYCDQVIVSRQARFHLYYFTLAEPAEPRLNLDITAVQGTAR